LQAVILLGSLFGTPDGEIYCDEVKGMRMAIKIRNEILCRYFIKPNKILYY